MPDSAALTLTKEERLCSRKLIEELFSGKGSKSLSAFPLRAVYMSLKDESEQAMMLVSVPKRHFKRAVKRNRVKRQVREAFRRHKSLINEKLAGTGQCIAIAFVWLDDKLYPTAQVEACVVNLLMRVKDRL